MHLIQQQYNSILKCIFCTLILSVYDLWTYSEIHYCKLIHIKLVTYNKSKSLQCV